MEKNYIIGRTRLKEGTSLFFGKVESVKNGIVYGVKEKDSHVPGKRTAFEIPKKDVLIDLGANPHPGSVYGQEVTSRFEGRKHHDYFGPINFLYKPATDVTKKLMEAFDHAASVLQKAKIVAPQNSIWEIRSKDVKGKWAGFYARSKAPEKNPHRFSIRPESVPVSVIEMAYVILHEMGHHVHSEYLTSPKANAHWVRVFNTSIKLQTIKKEQSQNVLELLLDGEERPSDFKTGLDEEQRNTFNWIIRTIKADHSLSIKELDLLFEAGYKEDIRSVWPKVTLNKKDLKPVLSEYATVSYRELWAETFAYHFTKRKMPEGLAKLLDKSLSVARANMG